MLPGPDLSVHADCQRLDARGAAVGAPRGRLSGDLRPARVGAERAASGRADRRGHHRFLMEDTIRLMARSPAAFGPNPQTLKESDGSLGTRKAVFDGDPRLCASSKRSRCMMSYRSVTKSCPTAFPESDGLSHDDEVAALGYPGIQRAHRRPAKGRCAGPGAFRGSRYRGRQQRQPRPAGPFRCDRR